MNQQPSMQMREAKQVAVRELAVRGLCFGYRDKAVVEGISFQLRAGGESGPGKGELVAIVGPNGCGKSTLLKLLLGALTPAAGTVAIDGKTPRELGRIAMARRVALVPQMAGADGGIGTGGGGGGYSVQQTVLMARYATHMEEAGGVLRAAGGLGIMGFESADDLALARVAMWNADVHHLAEREVETLSGGERQRVAIARAFAQETPVMLLDEPTSALDLFHQLELLEHLGTRVNEGRLVVMVTHDLNLAARCATRVMVMDAGRMVADGKPGEVLTPAVLEPVYHVKVRGEGEALRFERRG